MSDLAMDQLQKNLRETIDNLKEIRDKQDPPSKELSNCIDTLYEGLIDIIGANIKIKTKEYDEATAAMKEAVAKTKTTIDDLAKLEEAIAMVAKATGKVATLLAAVS